MADSPEGTESAGDSGDDGQLTIRIPNPKVYMARQSQWKGRRGKPRCDHCRLNNLKCDRVLPTCNHCAWASGRECKYTPLPTPAHRGIPRCDRCRVKNLKCDRNLPVCNHCADENETDCNYTPKKRHKVPSDHGTTRDRPVAPYAAKTASFLVSDMPDGSGSPGENGAGGSGSTAGASGSHTFESEIRTEPQIRQYIPPGSSARDREASGDGDIEMSFPPNDGNFAWGMIVTTPHIDPWMHRLFAPLPEAILQTLRAVNAIEMPGRHAYEEALGRFVSGLSPELRDTATFNPESYAEIARAVSEGQVAELPPRLRMWATCHHARAGSRKHHLILLPRDAFYNMNPADEEKLRANYIVQTDEGSGAVAERFPENGGNSLESAAVFERVPVQSQIYDILVYTHRNHGATSSMLFEARRIGIATITWPMVEMFVRLCPQCKMRSRGGNRPPADEEAKSQATQR